MRLVSVYKLCSLWENKMLASDIMLVTLSNSQRLQPNVNTLLFHLWSTYCNTVKTAKAAAPNVLGCYNASLNSAAVISCSLFNS